MTNTQQSHYEMRDSIMKLLSDDEVARVSTAEGATHLDEGDQYLDLDELGKGVCTAHTSPNTPMGRILPRKAVNEETWKKIAAKF